MSCTPSVHLHSNATPPLEISAIAIEKTLHFHLSEQQFLNRSNECSNSDSISPQMYAVFFCNSYYNTRHAVTP